MRVSQDEVGRFAAYMLIGLVGFFLLGGLTPIVLVVAILFLIVIFVAGVVGLGKD